MAVLDPKQKHTMDRYEVVQSNDGINGIPRGLNFPEIPIKNASPTLVDFSRSLTYADAGPINELQRNTLEQTRGQ
jgi:hypothetical protein